jgi:alpha-galactosidase
MSSSILTLIANFSPFGLSSFLLGQYICPQRLAGAFATVRAFCCKTRSRALRKAHLQGEEGMGENNQTSYFTLHGRQVSLVLEAQPKDAPLWRYFGARLSEEALPPKSLGAVRFLPPFSPDRNIPLTVFPLAASGWFQAPAMSAFRAGEAFAFRVTRAEAVPVGPHALGVEMSDEVLGVDVHLTLCLDPHTDILTCKTVLKNSGAAALYVTWLAAATLALPPTVETLTSFTGRHGREFTETRYAPGPGIYRRENRRGLTSHDTVPTGFAELADGSAFGAHLAWSGNNVQHFEALDDGRYLWQFGEALAPGEVILAPGETLETPELLATFSSEGRGGVMRNFQAAMRRRILWPGGQMKPRPVQINTWEGFYFAHDVERMKALASEAAALGVERFILDDGWFHGRDDDTTSLGDWWPDAQKYPEGLKPLADHVVSLGLEFGLWFEPEMVSPKSELARAHPDWLMMDEGRPALTARNQLVLDLTRPGVTDYLFAAIAKVLSGVPVAYIKWDHNRDLVAAGETPRYRLQVHALYGLLARLRAAFPEVEIESCAGGGGRIDAGILHHTHRFWTSDNLDALSRLPIQRGFLSVFPPEVMGAHVGTSPAHSTGRSQRLDFRAAVALPGHFGLELDPFALSQNDRARLILWIALHKQLRSEIHSGETWMGDCGDHLIWQAHGTSQALILFVYRTAPPHWRHNPALKLPMLQRGTGYTVRRIDPHGDGTAPYKAASDWLIESGLDLPKLEAEQAAIFRLSLI